MRITIILILVCLSFCSAAQVRKECGTKEPTIALFPDSLAEGINAPAYSLPYPIKIFIHIVANDNGLLRAVDDTSILRQINNMAQFYAPQNICFVITGIEQINSTDLNNHADTEEDELTPFLVANSINIFVHRDLVDLNGVAYNIPNYYFSLNSAAVLSGDNRSTTAHEMGHCFGLYHTFARVNGAENVARNGSCSNCALSGDLLCDTEADPHSDSYDTDLVISTNCIYSGSVRDDCNTLYNMNPRNVMAYGRRACRSVFTAGQGSRARAFITSTSFLEAAIAEDNELISTNQTFSSGRRNFAARNSITMSATSLIVNNTARVNFSATEVTISPGAHFAPTGADAYVAIRPGTICQ